MGERATWDYKAESLTVVNENAPFIEEEFCDLCGALLHPSEDGCIECDEWDPENDPPTNGRTPKEGS